MSVLMGVGWLFGFVASFTDAPALWWVFIIITSSHGMCLFIAFVCGSQFHEQVVKQRRQQNAIRRTSNIPKGQIAMSTISKAVVGEEN